MLPVKQVVLIDNDTDGNARKQQVLNNHRFSHNLRTCVNAGIALLYLQQQNEHLKSTPRLIILNIDTPIMNGFEFLSELKNSTSICTTNLMIAVIKDNLTGSQIDKLRNMGINHFIDSDICVETLSKIVSKQIKQPFANNSSAFKQGRDTTGLRVYAA